ncbi:MAG: hypothetical protein J6W35_07455 [Eubacterium sp.]|nr:hypothetical protein [Eubacterium sp.]
MTYLELLETVVDAVKDYAPSAAITHYKRGYIPTEDEMHMIRELNHKYADKENSSELLVESLVVEIHEKSYITLNLESLYEKNPTVDEIKEMIKDRVDIFSKVYDRANSVLDNIKDFDYIKDKLVVRLLPYKENKKKLEGVVYKRFYDIAVVLYIAISHEDGMLNTAKVKESFLKKWHKRPTELFCIAFRNVMRDQHPVIGDLTSVVVDKLESVFLATPESISSYVGAALLTTSQKTNGAVAIFIPGVAEKLAELFGDSFYVVFTSIHEAMIHENGDSVERMYKALDSTNSTFGAEDYLSSTVYFYDKDKKNFFPVSKPEA